MGYKKRSATIGVRFRHCKEIRMGSPFQLCEARLVGQNPPALPNDGLDYQALKASSPDCRALALVRWRSEWGNVPAFSLVVVRAGEVLESPPTRGCCSRIDWKGDIIEYRTAEGASGTFSSSR